MLRKWPLGHLWIFLSQSLTFFLFGITKHIKNHKSTQTWHCVKGLGKTMTQIGMCSAEHVNQSVTLCFQRVAWRTSFKNCFAHCGRLRLQFNGNELKRNWHKTCFCTISWSVARRSSFENSKTLSGPLLLNVNNTIFPKMTCWMWMWILSYRHLQPRCCTISTHLQCTRNVVFAIVFWDKETMTIWKHVVLEMSIRTTLAMLQFELTNLHASIKGTHSSVSNSVETLQNHFCLHCDIVDTDPHTVVWKIILMTSLTKQVSKTQESQPWKTIACLPQTCIPFGHCRLANPTASFTC